jgi:glycerol uptake facilitator-like aquaporin
LNPAVSLGLNMSSYLSDYYFGWFAFYWAAEMAGAALAALAFSVLRPAESEEGSSKSPGDVGLGVKVISQKKATVCNLHIEFLQTVKGRSF